jgi:hypothetical protein
MQQQLRSCCWLQQQHNSSTAASSSEGVLVTSAPGGIDKRVIAEASRGGQKQQSAGIVSGRPHGPPLQPSAKLRLLKHLTDSRQQRSTKGLQLVVSRHAVCCPVLCCVEQGRSTVSSSLRAKGGSMVEAAGKVGS